MMQFTEIIVQLRMHDPLRGTRRPALDRNLTTSTQEGLPTVSSVSMPHPVYGPNPGVPPPQPMGEEIEMRPSGSAAH